MYTFRIFMSFKHSFQVLRKYPVREVVPEDKKMFFEFNLTQLGENSQNISTKGWSAHLVGRAPSMKPMQGGHWGSDDYRLPVFFTILSTNYRLFNTLSTNFIDVYFQDILP